jgi:Protein of unknown function (DUF3006)
MICDDRGMVSLKATIDRFEDGYAVLLVRGEESIQIDFPKQLLPEGCKEGDILDIRISRNVESTDETRKRVANLIEKLKNKKYD